MMSLTYVSSSIGETERETIIFFPGRILIREYLRSLVVAVIVGRKCEWRVFRDSCVVSFFLFFFFLDYRFGKKLYLPFSFFLSFFFVYRCVRDYTIVFPERTFWGIFMKSCWGKI